MSPGENATDHTRLLVRMFMATTLPTGFRPGLPLGWKRPSIWKKLPRGFSCPFFAGGSAFQAPELSLEQTYMKPVFELKLDGGQSVPPRAVGAKTVKCLVSYGVKMQPTFTGFPSGAFQCDHTILSAH